MCASFSGRMRRNNRRRRTRPARPKSTKNAYAISVCTGEGLASPTVIGAQAANELLNIRGIKASFVITPYQGKLYFSARSIDEVNVQVIMERMGAAAT